MDPGRNRPPNSTCYARILTTYKVGFDKKDSYRNCTKLPCHHHHHLLKDITTQHTPQITNALILFFFIFNRVKRIKSFIKLRKRGTGVILCEKPLRKGVGFDSSTQLYFPEGFVEATIPGFGYFVAFCTKNIAGALLAIKKVPVFPPKLS